MVTTVAAIVGARMGPGPGIGATVVVVLTRHLMQHNLVIQHI